MTGPAPRKAVRVRVEGRVQGVWFRAWMCEQAGVLGLDGCVRNRGDGSVEAVFAGAPDAVDRMIVLARRGPPAAKVARVTVSDEGATDEAGFTALTDA